jgi:hypothetical protein
VLNAGGSTNCTGGSGVGVSAGGSVRVNSLARYSQARVRAQLLSQVLPLANAGTEVKPMTARVIKLAERRIDLIIFLRLNYDLSNDAALELSLYL